MLLNIQNLLNKYYVRTRYNGGFATAPAAPRMAVKWSRMSHLANKDNKQ